MCSRSRVDRTRLNPWWKCQNRGIARYFYDFLKNVSDKCGDCNDSNRDERSPNEVGDIVTSRHRCSQRRRTIAVRQRKVALQVTALGRKPGRAPMHPAFYPTSFIFMVHPACASAI